MNAADTIDAKRSKRKAIILPSHSGSREHTQGPWHGLSRPVLQVNGRRLKKGDHAPPFDDAVVATDEVVRAPSKQVRKSKLVKKPLNMNDKTTCDCCCGHRSTTIPTPIVTATSANTETDSSALAETTKISMLLTASQQQQQLLWAIAIMLGIFLLLFVICMIVYFVRQSPSAPSRVARVQYVYD